MREQVDELELWRHDRVAEYKRRQHNKACLKMERKSAMLFIISMAIMGIVFVLKLCCFDINCVSGLSMYPTLNDKDLLFVNKYDVTSIERYDIITLDALDSANNIIRIIKRVYGLPGETIEIYADGSVYINGVRLPDSYQILDETYTGDNMVVYKEVLGIGEYYVLGDNRSVSQDSRSYGPFVREAIKGVVIGRIYPFRGIVKTSIVGRK